MLVIYKLYRSVYIGLKRLTFTNTTKAGVTLLTRRMLLGRCLPARVIRATNSFVVEVGSQCVY